MLNEDLTTEFGEKRKTTLKQKDIEQSAAIADRIKAFEIKDGLHLPKYDFVPIEIQTENRQLGFLKKLVAEGYVYRYGPIVDMTKEHEDRLKKELGDIEEANLADYFLIVWDVVKWAKEQKIAVGPGRGSAAGSMVSYCLGITAIDPLKYGLIWERFYNAGRKGSLADIDMDFSKRRRGEVLAYIKERYGEDRVAQMCTFNTLAARAALKDTAKLLGSKGMPFEDANVMTRNVSQKPGTKIKKALEDSEALKDYEKKNPKLFRIAQMLEGCPKSRGIHAAGIIINDKPFSEGFPLRWNTKDKCLITEFDGETLEKLGHLKLDILGLKTLDVLDDVAREVNNGE